MSRLKSLAPQADYILRRTPKQQTESRSPSSRSRSRLSSATPMPGSRSPGHGGMVDVGGGTYFTPLEHSIIWNIDLSGINNRSKGSGVAALCAWTPSQPIQGRTGFRIQYQWCAPCDMANLCSVTCKTRLPETHSLERLLVSLTGSG